MKRFYLAIILIIPLIGFSQEIDEEFLDSLPEDVRKDVLEKMEAKKELEKPVYRRASTKVDKEKEEEEDIDPRYKVFGSDFFDTVQTSFMPINEPNLDDSYILDFGDVLEIQLIGQNDSIEEYELKRDGTINIPDIGKVSLAGLSLYDASQLIKAKVDKAYIGTQAFITLKNIRDINILISGNAYNPGIYTLNGNSNMLHAISMAGGINDIGSYRSISLIRDNKIIGNLDLYDVLIYGKSDQKTRLRSGDSIVVNPVGNIVSVESGVLRPGRYELKESETFADLVSFANGYNLNSDQSNILIKRLDKGRSSIIDIEPDQLSSTIVKNGDGLFIREYKYNSVKISGAVKNPGTYLLPIGTSLTDLIKDAGGYESSAYPFGGYLNNKNSLRINEESKEKLYNKFLNSLIKNSITNTSENNSLGLVLQQLKDAPVTGRIIVEFDMDILLAKPELDTILEDEDEIFIPYKTQQVYIQGEVSNPGAVRYFELENLAYYISASGGVMDTADEKTVFVVHPNGETKSISLNSRFNFNSGDAKNALIYPGSIIYVPKSSNLASNLEVASIWAPIISSAALSLTSLSVLNNQ
jgi:protein involved in polysaccharide export with SLBB domain